MPADVARPSRALCSTASRAAEEDLIGTAEPVHHWIAIELRSGWGRNPIDHANLPPAVRARLVELVARVPRTRVVFIRRDGTPPPGVQVYVARTRESGSVLRAARVSAIDDVVSIPFERFFDADEPIGDDAQPIALVCTHGQHDSCCGLRGYPTFEALSRRYEHVWQCSHVGGDRFAANVVVLPAGIYYARVEPGDAEAIDAALRNGRIVLRHYRGRSCYDRAAQVIETVVRRAHRLMHLDDVRVLDVQSTRPQVWIGSASDSSGTVHTIEVIERRTSAVGFLTCSAKKQEPWREYEVLRHERS